LKTKRHRFGSRPTFSSELWASMKEAKTRDWNAFSPHVLDVKDKFYLFAPRNLSGQDLVTIMVLETVKGGSAELDAPLRNFKSHGQFQGVDSTSSALSQEGIYGGSPSLMSSLATGGQHTRRSFSSDEYGSQENLALPDPDPNSWRGNQMTSSGIFDPDAPRPTFVTPSENTNRSDFSRMTANIGVPLNFPFRAGSVSTTGDRWADEADRDEGVPPSQEVRVHTAGNQQPQEQPGDVPTSVQGSIYEGYEPSISERESVFRRPSMDEQSSSTENLLQSVDPSILGAVVYD